MGRLGKCCETEKLQAFKTVFGPKLTAQSWAAWGGGDPGIQNGYHGDPGGEQVALVAATV